MKAVWRLIRAPLFIINLAISMPIVFFFFSSVSVGAWCEDGLRWLGCKSQPNWLPTVLGITAYTSLGVAGPAYLGMRLIGWPGVILGPALALVIIAILGRW